MVALQLASLVTGEIVHRPTFPAHGGLSDLMAGRIED
jgi:hypothetical protein